MTDSVQYKPHFFNRERRRVMGRFVLGLVVLAIFLFPVYWLFITAFKSPGEIFARPPVWFPADGTFRAFATLFKGGDVWAIYNSLILATVSTFFAMILGTAAAYSLARFKTGGDNLAIWIISQRMIPPIVIVFPIFLLFVWLGWIDSFVGLILLYTAFNLPYVIWMMRGYIEDIPIEVEESALTDSSSSQGRPIKSGGSSRPAPPNRRAACINGPKKGISWARRRISDSTLSRCRVCQVPRSQASAMSASASARRSAAWRMTTSSSSM